MIGGVFKLILLLFGFISISPKIRYLVGILSDNISSIFCGLLNMKIEKNGLLIIKVGCQAKT